MSSLMTFNVNAHATPFVSCLFLRYPVTGTAILRCIFAMYTSIFAHEKGYARIMLCRSACAPSTHLVYHARSCAGCCGKVTVVVCCLVNELLALVPLRSHAAISSFVQACFGVTFL